VRLDGLGRVDADVAHALLSATDGDEDRVAVDHAQDARGHRRRSVVVTTPRPAIAGGEEDDENPGQCAAHRPPTLGAARV
jgi:hypothetical protein